MVPGDLDRTRSRLLLVDLWLDILLDKLLDRLLDGLERLDLTERSELKVLDDLELPEDGVLLALGLVVTSSLFLDM